MIHSLDHVALSVSDIKRSLAFYRDFIGMKVVLEIDFSDNRIEKITGISGAKCRVIHLKLGDTILELFQYYRPTGKKIPLDFCQCDNGFIHIGFKVIDIHNHIKQLKEKGIELLGDLVEVRHGVWIIYFKGPDGEICEFREILE